MPATDPTVLMWLIYGLIVAALLLYATERIPLELTSVAVIAVLMILFHFFPTAPRAGAPPLSPGALLAGFANPALVAVVCLLIVGQGLVRTGILDSAAQLIFQTGRSNWQRIVLVIVAVMLISAVLNNIPVVVIFIPIMQALAARIDRSASGLMMPLSFASILGGMTTLIGSSTNLLVAGALVAAGETGLGFFDFTLPGLFLAAVGLVYVLLAVPRMLPDRASMARELMDGSGASGRQFIAQMAVTGQSKLIGRKSVGGLLPALKGLTLRMIQRGEEAIFPPFEDVEIRPGDVLVVAATRTQLMEAMRDDPGLRSPEGGIGPPPAGKANATTAQQGMVEVMVTPSSRLIGMSLRQIAFRYQFGCIVLGIQRRARMIRAQMTDIRLEAGDVLLLQGPVTAIRALRANPDLLLMEWSAEGLPSPFHAKRALLIFLAVVGSAATGVLPISVASFAGAALMIASGCINVRQATRAIDRNVVLMIAAALALGAAMDATGGAHYLAHLLLTTLDGAGPAVILSLFFLLVALLSNVLSTKACAVLFTPIAIGIAKGLGVAVEPFAVAIVFAANCSFASPIGYQTNLLVMGPGHYKFVDFARAGLPLIFLLWIAFSLFAPIYYGL